MQASLQFVTQESFTWLFNGFMYLFLDTTLYTVESSNKFPGSVWSVPCEIVEDRLAKNWDLENWDLYRQDRTDFESVTRYGFVPG